MRYFWKFLSLITVVLFTMVAIPMAVIASIHMWICRKANPDFDAISTMFGKTDKEGHKCPEAMGHAMAEMIKAMHPDLIAAAKAAADKTADEHRRPFAWEPEASSLPAINPIIPRVPNMPPPKPTTPVDCRSE
jgi:hypothetical protein